jgi:hypothetical protein
VIKIGLVWVLLVSLAMVILALCGIFSTTATVLSICLLFVGIAFIFTNCIGLSLSIFPHLAGSASAVWGFLAYLGGTLATSIMSYLPANTAFPLSVAFLIQCLLAFFVLWWGMPKKSSSLML